MNTPTNEFVTVHMRGLRATLRARAQAQRISASVLVRRAIERELGLVDPAATSESEMGFGAMCTSACVLSRSTAGA